MWLSCVWLERCESDKEQNKAFKFLKLFISKETKLVFCSSLLDIEEGFDNSLPSGYFSFSSYFVPQPVKLKF